MVVSHVPGIVTAGHHQSLQELIAFYNIQATALRVTNNDHALLSYIQAQVNANYHQLNSTEGGWHMQVVNDQMNRLEHMSGSELHDLFVDGGSIPGDTDGGYFTYFRDWRGYPLGSAEDHQHSVLVLGTGDQRVVIDFGHMHLDLPNFEDHGQIPLHITMVFDRDYTSWTDSVRGRGPSFDYYSHGADAYDISPHIQS